MDFSWTDEQLAFKKAVIKFAQQELNEGLIERDRQSEFLMENWLKCANFGLLSLPIPEQYGGAEADILTAMLAMEGFGYGCRDNGLILALSAQMWSVQLPILTFGTEVQKQKLLPGMCKGEIIGAYAMTEPDVGSDASSIRTRADRRDGSYVLNGAKMFVTNASIADVFLVFATVDPTRGMGGITAFLVPANTPGLTVSRELEKMGLRTSPMAELTLEGCSVTEDSRLGPEGGGLSIFNSAMEWERACILAANVGAMERQLETCIRYARQRRQFGKPIAKFQSVSNRIADMKVRLETARLILYKVAWLKMMGKSALMEAAIAKLYLSECFVQSGLDAIGIHGGYGYMTEFEIERDVRDAIGGTIYSGTNDIQRVIIARWLGL